MADTEREFDELSLPGLIAQEISAAVEWDGANVASTRARNIEYLRGEMNDVPARPNGSSITSRDINDTVAWILPGVMRTFMAGGRMVDYEPETPEDEEACEQASDYVNYLFFRENDGYGVLYDATHDALAVAGDGIVKHWWDDTPVTEISHHTGLTAEQLVALEEDEDIEILTQEQGDTQTVMVMDPATGQQVPQEIETFNVKVERTKQTGCIRIDTLAPEDFEINPEAIDIEDFRYCAHRDTNKTRSDLIEMGFDREKVEALTAFTTADETEEGWSRTSAFNQTFRKANWASMERIEFRECYLKIDVDGDGIAETIRAWYAGGAGNGDVLDWEVCDDDVPFSKIPCYPRPHLFTSESVADRTVDVQQIKTILGRQLLDNLYASALPMQEVDEGSVKNPDILTSPKFGGIVWKKTGSADIRRHEVPFVADKVLPAIELFNNVIERRTGVSRTSMALDPEALQNQSATASQLAHDAAYSQTELIARNMAEGWRKAFRAILRLVVKHQDRPRMIRLRDEFVQIDPRSWNANMDCTVNVGLGTGSRDRDLAMLSLVAQQQKELLAGLYQAGATEKAIEMLPKITMTLVKMGEAAGIKNAEDFFLTFEDQDVMQLMQQSMQAKQQPPLEVQIKQMELQAEQQKAQQDAQLQMQMKEKDVALDAEKERMKAEGNAIKEQAQLEADLMTAEQQRQNELMIGEANRQWEREKFTAEMQFRYDELALKRETEQMKADAAKAKAEQANRNQKDSGKAA